MSGIAPRPAPPFTDEQRAAVAARRGSWLLAANAGSGKTAVMAERFVRAVLDDGVPVGAILALTFTEKAAGELRDRIRARLAGEGAADLSQEAEAAWVGTIHGFCTRILRAHALAAGLDPRFTVLDEPASVRLQRASYEQALAAWMDRAGAPAVDLAAAYGIMLEPLIRATHEQLRSRGETRPRLPRPAVAPPEADLAGLRASCEACIAVLTAAHERKPGKQLASRLEEAGRCRDLLEELLVLGADGAPQDGSRTSGRDAGGPVVGGASRHLTAADLERLVFGGGSAAALKEREVEAFRDALEAARRACRDRTALEHLEGLDGLLRRFAHEYAAAKRVRSAVDFSDLELGVRDLFAQHPEVRDRWRERFELLMVDEFQDTNPLQMEVLSMLDHDNLFAVGDEKQSIYGFRHADVGVMRRRRADLGRSRVLPLARNFRSRHELLDVVNATFAPVWGEDFQPLVAGRPDGVATAADPDAPLRLFDPDQPVKAMRDAPQVEALLVSEDGWEDTDLGLEHAEATPPRRAEARAIADRIARLDRPAGDVVVLVRSTSSLRLYEEALEEAGLRTSVVGGRGYWSLEQVRDGLAYLASLANPLDEEALLGALASPFAGLGTDALVLVAEAGRAGGGLWAALRDAVIGHASPTNGAAWLLSVPPAERERLTAFVRLLAEERAGAVRHPIATLLERAVVATGYDATILARAGGDRRLANLRKLMRLARDFEAAEGRDLRAFLEHAQAQIKRLAEVREGQAPVESDALDAVRLMTVHAAKGLEFPVVVVSDLGRSGQAGRPRLLVADDGRVGLRIAALDGDGGDALAYAELAAEAAAKEDEEERRLFYVAFTRAEELLILSGCAAAAQTPARPGGPPLSWIAPALLGAARPTEEQPDRLVERAFDGRPARIRARLVLPGDADARRPSGRDEDPEDRDPVPSARGGSGPGPRHGASPAFQTDARPALRPDAPPASPPGGRPDPGPGPSLPLVSRGLSGVPAVRPAAPAPPRLSYSALSDYGRCGYRFYLRRILGLPEVAEPPDDEWAETPSHDTASAAAGLAPTDRGTLVHLLLERADLLRRTVPQPAQAASELGLAASRDELERAGAMAARFLATPLAHRLAAAKELRREAPFAFVLANPGGPEPLVDGMLDAVAREGDHGLLVVDYKTDRLDPGTATADVVARSYATQRITYGLAGLLDGAPRVEVAYCFLERPDEPVAATYTPQDVPALQAELSRLAEGVLAGRYPVTAAPHRGLCATCPGRERLCSWPPAVTLRRQPEHPCEDRQPTSAGTFSGSGGPS